MSASVTHSDADGDADAHADRFIETTDEMNLCFRTYGDEKGIPVLLIAGLGLQLISWPDELIRALTSAGYFVIAADNRDVGRSSRAKTKPPGKLRQLFAIPPAENYSLDGPRLKGLARPGACSSSATAYRTGCAGSCQRSGAGRPLRIRGPAAPLRSK